ncbi:hypothetical protein JJQ72_19575 [Paenibacillus sp. F411]|uniref:hypothetical protein n=1 Tax=Paenibacillus sp. F411 TaxID=2820239 RepID=UPI001AAF5F7D|nr:hypothetical protein [Paenibacillus sp. F411]MBO2946181.1 hypothetical protein [Paenibacillus sp. F411]
MLSIYLHKIFYALAIRPFKIGWTPTEEISVRPGVPIREFAELQGGMIYYQTNKKNKTPVNTPTLVTAPEKQTNPAPETLSMSAKIMVAGIVTYKVGKFIISVVLVPPSGGRVYS